MTSAWLLVAVVCTTPAEVPTTAAELSAYITALRHREINQRREAWTQEKLREAREAVYDPLFKQPEMPVWLHRTWMIVLQGYPMLLVVVVLGCGEAVWRCWRQNRLGAALAWCVVWFIVLAAMHLLVRPDGRPAAVVRVDGVVLRQGNGLSYPPHVYQGLPIRLAAGVEAVVRTRRANAWVQLELAGGKLGWVPLDAVYLVEARP